MEKLILIIPCYNEAQRLNAEPILKFLDEHPHVEVLFVNDGSLDHTDDVLLALKKQHPHINVHTLTQNKGKAEAVRQGMLEALKSKPHYIGYWDADLSTPIELVDDFLNVLSADSSLDFILGARVKLLGKEINRLMWRHYMGRIFATCASMTLNLPVYDTQCGAKVLRVRDYTATLFEKPFLSRWIFDVELLARQMKAAPDVKRIYELPLRRWADIKGSKLKARDFMRAFYDLLRIFWAYRH